MPFRFSQRNCSLMAQTCETCRTQTSTNFRWLPLTSKAILNLLVLYAGWRTTQCHLPTSSMETTLHKPYTHATSRNAHACVAAMEKANSKVIVACQLHNRGNHHCQIFDVMNSAYKNLISDEALCQKRQPVPASNKHARLSGHHTLHTVPCHRPCDVQNNGCV